MTEIYDPQALEAFFRTALERHSIYKKRQAGEPRPWTKDPILHEYRFCNVFRQYDKCSKWIIDNIIQDRPLTDVWPAIIVYRYISTYSMFEALKARLDGQLTNLPLVAQTLRFLRREGMKFNGCFIRNPKVPGGTAPIHEVPFLLVDAIKEDGRMENVLRTRAGHLVVEYLKKFPSVKGFMGHQYLIDFSYCKGWKYKDRFRYAEMGPGSRQGMNILLGNPRRQGMTQAVWLKYAKPVLEGMTVAFKDKFPEEEVTMQEVQNWLCEFQKYAKYKGVLANGGKVKMRLYERVSR